MSDEIFGQLVAFSDVENAMMSHIQYWMDTYLAARERLNGIAPGSIARPRSYIVRQVFDALPGEEQTPLIVVVSNGTVAPPRRFGTNIWSADLGMSVTAVTFAVEAKQARELAGHYQAAILGMLIHHQVFMNKKVNMEAWTGFSVDDIPSDQARTMCSARLNFTVRVKHYVDAIFGGPLIAPDDPHLPIDDPDRVARVETEVTP